MKTLTSSSSGGEWCNPNFGLATKAKVVRLRAKRKPGSRGKEAAKVQAKRKPKSHITCSREWKKV